MVGTIVLGILIDCSQISQSLMDPFKRFQWITYMLSLLNRTINSVASVPIAPVVNVEDDKIQLLQNSYDVPSVSI